MMTSSKSEVLVTSDAGGQMANLSVWDPDNGSLLTNFKGFTSGQGSVCTLGQTFIVSSNPSKPLLNVWHVWRGDQRPVKQTLPGVATAVAVSNDAQGSMIAVAVQEVIYVWMAASGKMVTVIDSGGHYQKVTGLSFTSDSGHLVSVGDDGNVLVWPTSGLVSGRPRPSHSWSGHSLEVTGHVVSKGRNPTRVYTCSLDQTAKVHEVTSGNLLLDVTFALPLTAIAVDTLESNVFVGAKNGNIHTFSLRAPPRDLNMSIKPDKKNTFKGHTKAVRCLSVSTCGHVMASGADDFDVRLWDVKSGLSLRTLTHKAPLTNVIFQPVIPGLIGDVTDKSHHKPSCSLVPFEKTPSSIEETEIELVVRDQVPSAFEDDESWFAFKSDSEHRHVSDMARDRSGNGDHRSSASMNNGSEDNPEVTRLKEINQQLYQHALKNILSNQNS